MPHGKEIPHGSEAHARQRSACTAKGFAVQDMRTAKKSLSSVSLPGNLCRECTHGKAVAVHLGPFAVRSAARQ
jgi:hypothetical protein